jgi:hypothetical protein
VYLRKKCSFFIEKLKCRRGCRSIIATNPLNFFNSFNSFNLFSCRLDNGGSLLNTESARAFFFVCEKGAPPSLKLRWTKWVHGARCRVIVLRMVYGCKDNGSIVCLFPDHDFLRFLKIRFSYSFACH